MSPNERRKRLFEYLEVVDKWVTVKELASNLGVSERTMHTDIEKLNENLKESDSIIEKKRGVGIRLISHIKRERSDNNYDIEDFFDRKILILEKLLIQNKVVTFIDLADCFFVSPTSIKNDLEDIRRKLNDNTNISIVSDTEGTRIDGNEFEIREALIWLNQEIIDSTTLSAKSSMDKNKLIFKRFYGEELVDIAYDILFSFVKNNNSLLSDYYIMNTLNVYIVLLYRLIHKNTISHIDMISESKAFGDVSDYTSGSVQLLSRASSRLSISYSDSDVNYLAKYLVMNRFEYIPDELINNKFIEELVNHLSNSLSVDFKDDQELMKNLKQHIPPMIYRLKLNVRAENPFVEQIKNEFRETFHTVMLAVTRFEATLNVEFNDDEVALLTIYFQSAIEKQKENKRVLVICQYGIATSELLVNRLKSELSANDTIESAAVGELEFFELSNYDLIISSTDSIQGDNIINVSPFLNNQDIEFIKNHLNKEDKILAESDVEIQNIYPFLNVDYIFENADFKSRDALLQAIGDKLVKENYIEDSYIDTLIHRETMGNTDLPDGIATPHGDINLVNKSLIVLINNQTKIRWNKYYVDKIFILLINKEDTMETKKIIKEIYALINDKTIMKHYGEYLGKIKEDLKK